MLRYPNEVIVTYLDVGFGCGFVVLHLKARHDVCDGKIEFGIGEAGREWLVSIGMRGIWDTWMGKAEGKACHEAEEERGKPRLHT